MKEDAVKEVFIKYLQNLGKTPLLRKKNVPGPDVIIEGHAYECKGNVTFKRHKVKINLVTEGVMLVASQEHLDSDLSGKVKKDVLSKTLCLGIKEIIKASKVSRQFINGFLNALEEKGDVYLSKVVAKIYSNGR